MGIVLTLCAVVFGAAGGCRDLVQPELVVDAGPEPFVEITIFGLDSVLDRAIVTIDNFDYVDAEVAGQWQAESYLGKVKFVGAVPSTYDVSIETVRPSDTPGWVVKGVALLRRR